ncbi:MAG: ribosome small subunit-dependent GTPase A [Clostridia bacterium]|nr:ribosome small subunit-dependent GTPase A [Clostridia bacterium]MBR0422623.1 ribosome small subunit-dependent GTPase A [Clostridia bacterium]
MEGSIIKGVGGFYYVSTDQGVITSKARGAFRKEGITPVVGDRVTLTLHASGYAQIDAILPRRNLLIRPAVANVDRLLIVISAHLPEPDWLLCDKLIVQAKLNDIEPVLVLNKADEADPSIREAFERDYGLFPRVVVSARTGEGLHALQDAIRGKICCFAGQSAVGKSSLMNALLPELDLPVGELTRKTDRGRHTTRHAQLWPCFGGALLDTPGFSLYEPDSFDEQLLLGCYPEFALADPCRFPGCMHRSEPGCGVKALLTDGRLSPARYERYVQIANDFTFRRKHQYD